MACFCRTMNTFILVITFLCSYFTRILQAICVYICTILQPPISSCYFHSLRGKRQVYLFLSSAFVTASTILIQVLIKHAASFEQRCWISVGGSISEDLPDVAARSEVAHINQSGFTLQRSPHRFLSHTAPETQVSVHFIATPRKDKINWMCHFWCISPPPPLCFKGCGLSFHEKCQASHFWFVTARVNSS